MIHQQSQNETGKKNVSLLVPQFVWKSITSEKIHFHQTNKNETKHFFVISLLFDLKTNHQLSLDAWTKIFSFILLSGMNFRGFSLNVPLPTAKSANEMTTLLENNGENSTTAVKRRIFDENALINSSISSDSANNLLNIDVPRQRANTSDSVDIVAPTKPHFDIVTDLPSDNFDSIETKSQLIPSIGDDQESISSSTKSRKSLRTSKLFKSFSNIRFRKKTSTT